MANRIDNVRLVQFLANKDNTHNFLANQDRPMLNTLVQVTEEVTLRPGEMYYFPSQFCNAAFGVTKNKAKITITIDATTNKPVFSGGVKTK